MIAEYNPLKYFRHISYGIDLNLLLIIALVLMATPLVGLVEQRQAGRTTANHFQQILLGRQLRIGTGPIIQKS